MISYVFPVGHMIPNNPKLHIRNPQNTAYKNRRHKPFYGIFPNFNLILTHNLKPLLIFFLDLLYKHLRNISLVINRRNIIRTFRMTRIIFRVDSRQKLKCQHIEFLSLVCYAESVDTEFLGCY